MTTISYQCDICKRAISKTENKSGLTVFGKCIITQGCHGKLYKTSRNIDDIREVTPFAADGLMDYVPRKAFFEHPQTLLTNQWFINHNLATSPAVTVYVQTVDGSLVQLDQDNFTITVVNKNSVNLTFNQSYRGVAHCVARSTTTTTVASAAAVTEIKVTNNGLLTMAIPEVIINTPPAVNVTMSNLPFNIQVMIKTPSEPEAPSLEFIGADIDRSSPWSDWPRILVKKRKNYVIRTKNILKFLAFGSNAKIDSIPNGTEFRFTTMLLPGSSANSIESRELFFLLSNPPYASIDKVKDKLIDVGEMIASPTDAFVYRNGELYVKSTVVETTYPNIMRVI